MTDRRWTWEEVAEIGEPILGADGRRIGVLTADGPVYCADPQYIEDIAEMRRKGKESSDADLAARARRIQGRDMSRLLDVAEVSPSRAVSAISQLTFEERKALLYALQHNDSVSLPAASSDLCKTREYRDKTKHATEVAMGRAFRRLYTRGLATVEKRDGGLVWLDVSRERILSVIRSENAAKRRGGGRRHLLDEGTLRNSNFTIWPFSEEGEVRLSRRPEERLRGTPLRLPSPHRR